MKNKLVKIISIAMCLLTLAVALVVPISAESTSFRDEFEFMFDKSFPNMENKIYLDTPDIGERNGLELAEYPMNVNNFSVANGVIMVVVRDQSEEGQFWEYVFEFNDLQIKSERNTRYLGQEYHYVIDDHETILVYERWLETWVYTVSCLIVPDEGEMPFGTYPSRRYDQYEYVFTLSREYYTSDDFELSEFGKDGYRNIETKLEQRFWYPDDDGGGFKLSHSSATFMGIAWNGYSNGYTDGQAYGEILHADDYQNGYDQGYADAKDVWYKNGLKDGFNGADTSQAWSNMKNLIFAVFDAPFYVISTSLDFNLFGINIAGTLIALISLAIIVWILKIIVVKFF